MSSSPTALTPASVPVTPAQPNSAIYSVFDLALFKSYTRASYLAAFGVDAPTYNPKLKSKSWFDTSVLAGSANPDTDVVTYHSYEVVAGAVVAVPLTMTVREASQVNLYGIHSYPPYQIQPSSAYIQGVPGTAGMSFNPLYLSMQADALALAAAFGLTASAVADTSITGVFNVVYPSTELRRQWSILYKGTWLSAGMLMNEMNANGVGAPGSWDFSGAEPNWISAQPSSLPAENPAWDFPQRPLLANESTSLTMMGTVNVFRTDMTSAANPAPATGGGLSTAQASQLTDIQAAIHQMLGFFNLGK